MKDFLKRCISLFLIIPGMNSAHAIEAGNGKTLRPDTVTICVPDTRTEFISLLESIAKDRNIFKKHNLNVEEIHTAKPHERLYADPSQRNSKGRHYVRSERSDFGVLTQVAGPYSACAFGSSNLDRIILSNDGVSRIRPLAISYYGDQYDTHLVVAQNSKIKSVKDLRGRTIHIGQLPTYMAVENLLSAKGVNPDTVNIFAGLEGGKERLAALESGKLAAMTAYLPSMSYLLAAGKVRILEENVVSRYLSKKVPHSMLIVNKEFAAKNPNITQAFVDAIQETYEFVLKNPGEIPGVFRRHRSPRGGESWYDITDTEIEKAAAFIGRVKMVQVGQNEQLDNETFCDSMAYQELIAKSHYIPKVKDLSSFIGVSESGKSCKSL